jgi:pimeloyl-ACP methyl ester carboxylesterase
MIKPACQFIPRAGEKAGFFEVKYLISALIVLITLTAVLLLVSPEKKRITNTVRNDSGSEFIKLSEGWTEYELAGPENGEPVILIHGLSVPMFDWDRQFYILAESGYRVLRYNHYGRGLSDRPRGNYDAGRYIRQIEDLMASQNWTRTHIIAHSMGGAIAAEFVKAHPESVDHLVLLAPALYMAEGNTGITLIRIPLLGDIMAMTALSGLLASRAEALFEAARIPEAEEYKNAFREQIVYYGFSRSVKSLFRHDLVKDLSDAYRTLDGRKTLLIWGSRDESIPEDHIKTIESLVPDLELKVLDDVGHMLNMEASQTVNPLILDFLK